MHYFLFWYLTLALFALAALPLGWTWLRHLPDRGWGLLRPLGLLLVGVAVWFLGTFGVVRLNAGSGLGGLVVLAALGGWALHRWGGGWPALRAWLRENRALILMEEALFFVALAFWVAYRVHEAHGIAHTEQPMDFALMNAILRGGEMPPNDPWLSGFAISYYYLGYLIVAQVTALSGVPSGVAYNLGLMTLAAMAAVGSFSLAYNLILAEARSRRLAMGAALLAPLLLLGISNLTGLLTMTYHRGMLPDALYGWLAVHEMSVDPVVGTRPGQDGWWWWKASRTVLDLDAGGGRVEVIDEFPFFSFLLGDMHPHVLALPFALLAMGVALNALRGALAYPVMRRWRGALLPPEAWGVGEGFGKMALLLALIVVGAFVMLNTWDLPTAATILLGVWLLAAVVGSAGRLPAGERPWEGWGRAAALLVMGAALLFMPFLISFRSQAGGIRLSPFATLPQQYLLMFGLFWLVLLPLALSQLGHVRGALRAVSRRVMGLAGGSLLVSAGLLAFLLNLNLAEERVALLVAVAWLLVPLLALSLAAGEDATPLLIAQVAGFPLLAGLALQRWTTALVAALLGLMLLALWARLRALVPWVASARQTAEQPMPSRPLIAGGSDEATPEAVVLRSDRNHPTPELLFALGLASVALLLTMGSEIFYIKDGFPGRMNTIFKLYYQAWTLMGLASLFGLVYLARRMPRWGGVLWLSAFALLLLASTWYPVAALTSKADWDGPAHWDGRFWMQGGDPDRFAAIQWLDALPGQAVILERPGDQYNASHSALAGWTGHSTLVGWAGHELQWRGTYDEVARREPVIEEIYQTTDPARARALLDEWGVDYVALTPQEIDRYNLAGRQIEKFSQFMVPAFQQGSITIFGR